MPVPRRSVRAGGIAMKTSVTVLVLVLLLLSISGWVRAGS